MSGQAARLRPENQGQVQAFIEQVLARSCLPGISVAMYVDGDNLEAAAGVSDVSSNHPMSTRSLFELGCINKFLVALLVLELEQKGDIQLDDALSTCIPELRGRNADRISLRHLLSHSAGYQGENLADPDVAYDYSWREFAQSFNKRALLFEPGTLFDYTHSATVILCRVVEMATGRSVHDLFRERIFKPLGIPVIPSRNASMPLCVRGHLRHPVTGLYQETSPVAWCDFWSGSIGGPWISIRDLAKIGHAVLHGSGTFSSGIRRGLFTTAIKLPGVFAGDKAEQPFVAFGLGCARYPTGSCGIRSRSRGTCLALRFDIENGIVVAVGINAEATQSRDFVVNKLLNAMLPRDAQVVPDLAPAPQTNVRLEDLVGTYQGATNDAFVTCLGGDCLLLQRSHNPGMQEEGGALRILERKDDHSVKPADAASAISFGVVSGESAGSFHLMVGERFYRRVDAELAGMDNARTTETGI